MKAILLSLVFCCSALTAQAAYVKGAKVDASSQTLLVDVEYSGGCAVHKFALNIGACYETFPVQCKIQLIHDDGGDDCEAMVGETLRFPLADEGLLGSYYERAYLTILGDGGTKAEVQLPQF